jgi:dihydrofolate reductase
MRRIVAGLFVSLDGVIESPELWTGPFFSDEVSRAVGSLIESSDTLLLGRVTYETFERAFRGKSGRMADHLNGNPKVVISRTLDKVDWAHSTLVNSNTAEQISALKKMPGRNINVSGSATLVTWLVREHLLDEIDLLVFPVVVGGGKRIFEGEGENIPMKLVSSAALSGGVMHLNYEPALAADARNP